MIFQSFKNLKKLEKRSIYYHGLVLAVIVLTSIIFENPIITLILGGILYTALAIAVMLFEKKENSIIITPVSVFFLYIFFSYGISPLFIASELTKQDFIEFVNQLVYDKSIEMGFLINSTGIFFMHLGLQIFRPRKNIFFDKISQFNLKALSIFHYWNNMPS